MGPNITLASSFFYNWTTVTDKFEQRSFYLRRSLLSNSIHENSRELTASGGHLVDSHKTNFNEIVSANVIEI